MSSAPGTVRPAGRYSDDTFIPYREVFLKGSNIVHAETAVPDNTAVLTGVEEFGPAQFVYIGVSGDVVLELLIGDVVEFTALAAGMWHPMPPFVGVTEDTTAVGIVVGY